MPDQIRICLSNNWSVSFFSKTFLSLLNGCHGKLIFGQTLAYIARGSQPCQGMLRITPGFATPLTFGGYNALMC